MANITLYYIDGISRENTPYFENATAQSTFMANHVVHAFTDGFYPPKYRDTITLDLGTGFTGSRFNYLSLLFNSRQFYYFIDSIEYISEDIVALHISIDTIQTYMFDINIHESIIERKFIDRCVYVDDNLVKINRNYLRENLSNGVWQEPEYSYINLDTFGLFIIRSTDYENNMANNANFMFYYLETQDMANIVKATGITYIVPFAMQGLEITRFERTPGSTADTMSDNANAYIILNKAMGSAHVDSMVYLPFNPLNALSKTLNTIYVNSNEEPGIKFDHTLDGDYASLRLDNTNNTLGAHTPVPITVVSFKTYNTISLYTPNVSIGTSYSSSYITQVIDNNYQTIFFGERSALATFPLFYEKGIDLYLKYCGDIQTGARMYGITDDKNDIAFSKGGLTVAEQPIYLTKMTDSWLQWQAYNRATIGLAMANYFVQGAAGGIAMSGQMAGLSAKESNYYNYLNSDYAMAKGQRASRSQQLLFAAEKNEIEARAQSRQVANAGSLVSTATSEWNAWLAPDKIKQSSIISQDFISGSNRNVFYTIKVLDFEQVAWYYHRCGFLVDTPFKSVWFHQPGQAPSLEPFLKTLASRYYFDYYKFQYADIDLTIMCTEDMIADVISRLTSGIRVWYVDHGSICDYQYDNVERSVLS